MLSHLFRRGGAQMGREEGGGENATPLEHLAPSKPCITLSKPAVGSLPWLAILFLPLLLSQLQNHVLSQLFFFLLGVSDPFLFEEGALF